MAIVEVGFHSCMSEGPLSSCRCNEIGFDVWECDCSVTPARKAHSTLFV
jgi:hypothetical protein